MRQLLVATTNPGKLAEFRHALKDCGWQLVSRNIGDVAETGTTFRANAILKAKAYAKATGLVTIADDSGLSVTALHDRPGVYSARYGTDDQHRIAKLLSELKSHSRRSAQFECVIAIYDPTTRKLKTCRGIAHGRITQEPLGTSGFGYDPIFYSLDLGQTFGEATIAQKNRVSHRGRALVKACLFLQQFRV